MIKRILMGLGTTQTAAAVTAHAIDLAVVHSAELVGLTVTDTARLEWTGPRPMGVGVEVASAALRAERHARVAADIASAREVFSGRCRAAGVAHRLIDEEGDPLEIATNLIRYHDMAVFGLGGLFEHGVVPEPPDALERLIAEGVRPILAVSEEHRPIRRVLVAYSGSLESAKTFKHFVQCGLYADAEVRIVCFSDDYETARRRCDLAADYFRAHGRSADTDAVPGDPRSLLLDYAATWRADLIVAGNSGRSMIVRKLFGETALTLIRTSPLPLFLAQ
jgi:nucleotide-binding universal stress UspA family protein